MTPRITLSPELRKLLEGIRGKRARIVADHIAKHGSVSTDEIREKYGYVDPRRAKQDLQEQGVPIDVEYIKNDKGNRIAHYKFGELSRIVDGRFNGRRAFPKAFKKELANVQGETCGICQSKLAMRYLQIDHRIPYEISGELPAEERNSAEFMLVCSSCNRAKSWSCEHCPNWTERKTPEVCTCCYRANPVCYTHVATIETRRVDVVWAGSEVPEYEHLAQLAAELGQPLPDFVRRTLAKAIKNGRDAATEG